ncbi:MAG: hypothetical protein PHX21_10460 [bacterium]|nr:hypothetical protein [bacterium]
MVKRKFIHKKNIYWVILLFFLLGIGELTAFILSHLVPGHVYYTPPTNAEFDAYHKMSTQPNFSHVFGWLPQQKLITSEGYRISPDGEGLKKIASVYGESFAFGDDVNDREAWTNVLSKKLGRKVENYGVSFYSTGQALLRFMGNTADTPEVAILVIMSENIVRNINQNCCFIYSPLLMFRPVWYLEGDGIGLDSMPDMTKIDAATYLVHERSLLRHEYFWPESSRLSKRKIHFPYLYYLPRAIFYNIRITSGLLDEIGIHVEPWYAELYNPKHPSGAYELTLRICEKFVTVAHQRGVRRPIILFLPRDRDISYYFAKGTWGYEHFWTDARKRCPEFYTLSDNIARDFPNKDESIIKEYFYTSRRNGIGRSKREVGGHYNAKGNDYLAKVIYEIIITEPRK